MGIRFLCPACGKKIHVKDFLAGRRGICPKCETGVDIPLTSQLAPGRKKKSRPRPDKPRDRRLVKRERAPAGRLLGTTDLPSVDPLVESPSRRWYVATADGREVGPLPAADIRQMIEVGSIQAESSVRREDWPERLVAAAVWPDWRGADPFAAKAPSSKPAFAGQLASGVASSQAAGDKRPSPSGADDHRHETAAMPSPGALHSVPPASSFRAIPQGTLPAAALPPALPPMPVDSPTAILPPAVVRSLPPSAGVPASYSVLPPERDAAPPAVSYSVLPEAPYSVGPQPPLSDQPLKPLFSDQPPNSSSPDPGLYYSRGSNAAYIAAIVILVMVVAVLAVAAYRVIVDPPAWMRPQPNDVSGRSSQTFPFF